MEQTAQEAMTAKALIGPLEADATRLGSFGTEFWKGIGSGILAKSVGLLNQLLAIPMVAYALGQSGLSAFLLSISIASWFNLTALGSQNALTVELVRARSSENEARRFLAAASLLYGAGALFCLIAGFAFLFVHRSGVLGQLPPGSVLCAATMMNALYILTWMSEPVLAAHKKTHWFNFASAAGSIASLAGTCAAYVLHLRPEAFVIAYYLSLVIPTVGMYALTVHRGALRPRDYLGAAGALRQLIERGWRNFGFQASWALKTQVTLFLVAIISSSENVADCGGAIRFCSLYVSGFSVLFNPLLAELSHLKREGKTLDFRRLWRRALARAAVAASLVTLVLLVVGPAGYRTWLGHVVPISSTTALLWSVMAAIVALEWLMIVLSSPVASTRALSALVWSEGILTIAIGYVLTRAIGVNGMFIAISSTSAVVLSALTVFMLRNDSHGWNGQGPSEPAFE